MSFDGMHADSRRPIYISLNFKSSYSIMCGWFQFVNRRNLTRSLKICEIFKIVIVIALHTWRDYWEFLVIRDYGAGQNDSQNTLIYFKDEDIC